MRKPLLLTRETDVQADIIGAAQAVGCYVYRTGTHRRGVTGDHPTSGLSDLVILSPVGTILFETKAPGGKRSDEQVVLGERCLAFRSPYGYGGLAEFLAVLRTWGVVQ